MISLEMAIGRSRMTATGTSNVENKQGEVGQRTVRPGQQNRLSSGISRPRQNSHLGSQAVAPTKSVGVAPDKHVHSLKVHSQSIAP